jgi:hypothetical protein
MRFIDGVSQVLRRGILESDERDCIRAASAAFHREVLS